MLSSRVLAVAAGICTILGSAVPAAACRCIIPPPPREEAARRDVVFSGRVVAVEVIDWRRVAKIQVLTCWKGGVGGTITVTTPEQSAGCGVDFQVDTEYLVYGNVTSGIGVHSCSRTRLLANAAVDIDELGRPACTTGVAPGTWSTVKRLYTE